jgi:hypothetical protein
MFDELTMRIGKPGANRGRLAWCESQKASKKVFGAKLIIKLVGCANASASASRWASQRTVLLRLPRGRFAKTSMLTEGAR